MEWSPRLSVSDDVSLVKFVLNDIEHALEAILDLLDILISYLGHEVLDSIEGFRVRGFETE